MSDEKAKTDAYSFCESVYATAFSPWHIRRLTDTGRKPGGDIDTPSLCGVVGFRMGWDLSVAVNRNTADGDHVCAECRAKYGEETAK